MWNGEVRGGGMLEDLVPSSGAAVLPGRGGRAPAAALRRGDLSRQAGIPGRRFPFPSTGWVLAPLRQSGTLQGT